MLPRGGQIETTVPLYLFPLRSHNPDSILRCNKHILYTENQQSPTTLGCDPAKSHPCPQSPTPNGAIYSE